MQGANLIIECLIKEGVTTMFGYPGAYIRRIIRLYRQNKTY